MSIHLLNDCPRATPVLSATSVSRIRKSKSWSCGRSSPEARAWPPLSVSLVSYNPMLAYVILGQLRKAWPNATPV
eukprot:CAMPEP_0204404510 /NCGR_PEP_ID=MMETSP0470-20130426/6705_1 /ASSEMBLY_ACC=CAM_ASM_000385 /TAXON_ID=2969 /ORGANISM="Oxyrrhis marina" /LENGTH=74 /DNA_ID=CAMNT_0051399825 /DNA_START=40 /DNA_END=261 /DNA_ORIENTATION=+